ncbi:MAG: hypothetical protein LBV40_05345, partial [Methanomicrobiales archaeon]|jgi:PKD repeat protein|nr:hypothetical protein [Methanomicrobiales archaeon]
LDVGNIIILFDLLEVKDWQTKTVDTEYEITGMYVFVIEEIGGNLVARVEQVLFTKDIPGPATPGPNPVTIDTYTYADSRSETVINPFIMSISADPILGGAYLSVDAWSGDGIVQSYQWQVQQPNGSWVNIPGATQATFEYTGLGPGEYTVRCVVTNSTGGETISIPVRFVVS